MTMILSSFHNHNSPNISLESISSWTSSTSSSGRTGRADMLSKITGFLFSMFVRITTHWVEFRKCKPYKIRMQAIRRFSILDRTVTGFRTFAAAASDSEFYLDLLDGDSRGTYATPSPHPPGTPPLPMFHIDPWSHIPKRIRNYSHV